MSNAQRMKNLILLGYATREKFSAHTVRVSLDIFLIGESRINFVFKRKIAKKHTHKKNEIVGKQKRGEWSQCVCITFEHRKTANKKGKITGTIKMCRKRRKNHKKFIFKIPKANKMRTRFIVVSLTFHIVQCYRKCLSMAHRRL